MKYGASVELNKSVKAKDFLNRWVAYTGFNVGGDTIDEIKDKINVKANGSHGKASVYLSDSMNTFNAKSKPIASFKF